jgi:cell division protein FtsI (penicillin-binding protein 3)
VHKLISGDYAKDRYVASFAGMAPASNPRLVMVVTVDEPDARRHFGGQTAAPVFSRVMAGALRLLNIAPDIPQQGLRWAAPTTSAPPA